MDLYVNNFNLTKAWWVFRVYMIRVAIVIRKNYARKSGGKFLFQTSEWHKGKRQR